MPVMTYDMTNPEFQLFGQGKVYGCTRVRRKPWAEWWIDLAYSEAEPPVEFLNEFKELGFVEDDFGLPAYQGIKSVSLIHNHTPSRKIGAFSAKKEEWTPGQARAFARKARTIFEKYGYELPRVYSLQLRDML